MKNQEELDKRMINNNCENIPIRMKILQSEPNHEAAHDEKTKLYNEAYKSPIRFLLDTLEPGYIEYKGVDAALLTKYCQIHNDNISTEKVEATKPDDLFIIIEIIGAIGRNKNDDLKPLQKQMLSALAKYVQQHSSFPIEVTNSIIKNYSEIMTELDSASLTKLSLMFKNNQQKDAYYVANIELKKGYVYFYESAYNFKRNDGSKIKDKSYDYCKQQSYQPDSTSYGVAASAINHQLIANEIIEGTIKKILDNNVLHHKIKDEIQAERQTAIQAEITEQVKQTLDRQGWNYLFVGQDGYQSKIKSFFSEPSVQDKLAELTKRANDVSKVKVNTAITDLNNDKKNRFNDREFWGIDVREYRNGILINNEGNTMYRDVLSYLTLGISSLIFELLDYLGVTESYYQAAKKNAEEHDAAATIELKEETIKHIGKETFDDLLPLFLSLKQNEEEKLQSKEEEVGSQASGPTKPFAPTHEEEKSASGPTQPSAPPHERGEAAPGPIQPSAPPLYEEEGTPGLIVSDPQSSKSQDSELTP